MDARHADRGCAAAGHPGGAQPGACFGASSRQEGVRWRRTRLWATSKDLDFVPKRRPLSRSTKTRRQGRRSLAGCPQDIASRFRWTIERGPEKIWVYGALCVRALCVRDGQTLTQTAPSRTTAGSLTLLQALDQAHPQGNLYLITDTLASHSSGPIRDWLAIHPLIQQASIPVGASWLNLIEGWRRKTFRRSPQSLRWCLARHRGGHRLRHPPGHHPAQSPRPPWIWGRPSPPHRTLRRCFVDRL